MFSVIFLRLIIVLYALEGMRPYLSVRTASISTNADCHAFFLSLGKLASELSHLFQLGRGCHAVALGHTADGDNALVLPLAVRAG